MLGAQDDDEIEPVELINRVEAISDAMDQVTRVIGLKISTKIVRVLLQAFGQFCRIDLRRVEKVSRDENEATGDLYSISKAAASKRRGEPAWSMIIQVIYFWCCIRAIVYIVYQYKYDHDLYQHNHFKSLAQNNQNQRDSRQANWTEEFYKGKVRAAEQSLRAMGAPFYKLSYFVEVATEYIVSLSLAIYILSPLYIRIKEPLDCRFANMLLETKTEQLQYLKVTCNEVNKFIFSSRNFTRASFRDCNLFGLDESIKKFIDNNESKPLKSNTGLRRLLIDQEHSIRILKQMTANDLFKPLNWRPEFVEKLSLYYCYLFLGCIIYGCKILLVVWVTLPYLYNFDYKLYSIDVLVIFENAFLVVILILSVAFFLSFTFVSCMDQIMYINELRKLIDNVSLRNQLRYYEITKRQLGGYSEIGNELQQEFCSRQMNTNLLYAFIHYKIFVAQTKSDLKFHGTIALVSIVVFFTLPIMARLHEPYINLKTKLLQIYVCLATSVFLNFVMIPVCYLHSRSLDLYKSMCSLLAHTIEQSSGDSIFYNAHLVLLLRKELSYPDLFARQFATVSIGVRYTYPNLVKIHFWFGIILLSLISGVTTDHDAFLGRFLSDPFGLY